MKVRIDALQIVEGYRLSKKLFIKWHCEATVQVMTMENRDAYDSPDKVKVRQMFLIKRKTNSQQLKIKMKQYVDKNILAK